MGIEFFVRPGSFGGISLNLLAFALPMLVPILAVFAMDVPIGQLLKAIAGTVL